jgi:hypothetical protein
MVQDSKKDRIQKAYDYLYNKGVVHSVTELADLMGRARPGVSNALNGSPDYLNDKFLTAFGRTFSDYFRMEWLLSGEGQMLTPKEVARYVARNPEPNVEIPASLQELLDRAIIISKRNEELVERLAQAVSDNRQLEITMQSMAERLKSAKAESDKLRLELLTAVEAVNKFREVADTMRKENESLKSSNTKLGKHLDKAAELFQQLNNQVAMLLNHTGLRYEDVSPHTHVASEPFVSPNK